MAINLNTLLSDFDERGTLLKFLTKVYKALLNGNLSSVEIVSVDSTHKKFKFNFGDGTYLLTDSLELARGPQGDTGPQGPTGATGATGATGNGISSVALTSTVGLVDTYTITFTNGTTTTFNVTNGASGTVTPASLASKMEGSDYISVDLNEAETKVVVELDETKLDTVPTEDSDDLITSGGVFDGLAAKQDELSVAQLAAANSGIDSTKVATYTGYATTKQDTITASTDLTANTINAGLVVVTTEPTADNTAGTKIAYLESEPATYYNGYIYLIKE